MKLDLNTSRRSGLVVRSGEIDKTPIKRIRTGIKNLDDVFGGEPSGIPIGFVIQFAGPPGTGKSTLLTQIVGGLLVDRSLYITSEETAQRIAQRAERLNVPGKDRISITETTDLDTAKRAIRETDAEFVIVDSLQGLRKAEEPDEPTREEPEGEDGEDRKPRKARRHVKHTQLVVRDIANDLIEVARRGKRTMILVAHMNKENELAGLREIEHNVDIVARFDKKQQMSTRRDFWFTKNREADTAVRAIFEMTGQGLLDRGVIRPGVASLAPVDANITDPSEGT